MGPATGPRLLVAGLSVRAMAEAARRDGFEVIALDLFGDADTRAASAQWHPIGHGATLQIEPAPCLAALARAAAEAPTLGWICGSGFEALPDLLAAGAEVLPLIGCAPAAQAGVRDPARFFSALAAYGVAHPEVAWRRPAAVTGWLRKDAGSCGGRHVRPARPDDADPPPPGHYWQRQADGQPMSMTLLAAGQGHASRAAVLGVNLQLVEARPDQPYGFAGVVGPLMLPGRLPTALQGLAERLVARFGLAGLCGVDFLLQPDGAVQVLEVNPRPPASLALYGPAGGLMRAHVDACLHGRLPTPAALARLRPASPQGWKVLFAPRALPLGPAALTWLAGDPRVHDRPAAPLRVAVGEPLCSLSAGDLGPAPEAVRQALMQNGRTLWTHLEALA